MTSRTTVFAAIATIAFLISFVAHSIRIAPPEQRFLLYNADLLYLPALYEALARGDDLTKWRLSTAPYFFPDMPLFFLVRSLSGNLHYAIAWFGVSQSVLFVIGIAWLSYRIHRSWTPAISSVLIAALFFSFLHTLPFPFHLILASVFHFGVLLVLPYILILVLNLLETPTGNLRWPQGIAGTLLLLLVALTTASDILSLFQVSIPTCIATILARRLGITWKSIARLCTLVVTGTILGFVGTNVLVRFPNSLGVEYGWSLVLGALNNLWLQVNDGFIQSPILFWSALIFLVATLFVAVQGIGLGHRMSPQKRTRVIIVWILLSSFIVNSIVILGTGKLEDRYILPTLFLSTFFGWPLLFSFSFEHAAVLQRRLSDTVFISAASLLLIMNAPTITGIHGLSAYRDYYPDWIRCIDDQSREHRFTTGFAHYWQARPLTLLSKAGVHAAPVEDRLVPRHWVNSLDDFHQDFDFALIDTVMTAPAYRVNDTFLQEYFGAPNSVTTCGTNLIYIYNRPEDILFRDYARFQATAIDLRQPQEEVTIPAAFLPSQVGEVTGVARWAHGDSPGYLTFGPYLSLTSGVYMFRIEYQAETENERPSGYWDVMVHRDTDSLNIIAPTDLPTAGEEIQGVFGLNEAALVEVRVFYEGYGTMKVRSISMKKLQ